MHVNVPLGKRYDDAGLIKCLVDGAIQLVNQPALVLGLVGPAQKFKIERRIAEVAKPDAGFRFGRNERIAAGRGNG